MSHRPPALDAALVESFVSNAHGIPLVEHARAGGEEAREVLELLESR